MLLLLIRHAQAAAQDENAYPDDSVRPLVPKGRKAQRRISRELRKRKLIPTRVYSSPWKRAWQTARILIDETGLPKSARFRCDALAGPPDLAAIAVEVGEVGSDEIIALVGHEPWMSSLASLLLTGDPAGLEVDFAKSGVLGIETAGIAAEHGRGSLRFYLVPE
jgi:phosphohistidine phosphatase